MKLFFAVLCVTQQWALHVVIKRQFLHLYYNGFCLQLIPLSNNERILKLG